MKEYLESQTEKLMASDDAELVPFFDEHGPVPREGFASAASFALSLACTHEAEDVQLVLAVLAGELDLAQAIAERAFREPLEECARTMIAKAAEDAKQRIDDARHE